MPALPLLLDRLRRLRRRRLVVAACAAALRGLALLAATGAALVAVEAVAYLAPTWRLGLGAGVVTAVLAVVVWPLWRLRGRLALHSLALDAEDRAPELSQRLITALELGHDPRGSGRLYSPALLGAATAEAARVLGDIDDARLVPAAPLRRAAAQMGIVSGVVVIAAWAGGSDAGAALSRCLHPTVAYQRPQRTHVRVTPGDLEVVRGDDAAVSVHLAGDIPVTVRVLRREAGGGGWTDEEVVLEPGRGDSLRYAFDDVHRRFDYRILAGDGEAGPYHVAVVDPPSVTRVRVGYRFPEYSGLSPRVDEQGGDIRALTGTRVDFRIHASKPLAAAELVVDDSVRFPARVVDDRADLSWELPAAVDSTVGSHSYRVHLLDRKGIPNRDPIRHAVQVLRDGPPEVAIVLPGRDADIPESQQVSLQIEATDDYGVSRVDVVFRVNDGSEERLPLSRGGQRSLSIGHDWDLSARDLLPEDRVHYRAEALDNDSVTGPNKAVSREFVLRFPSLYELFDEAAQQQQESLSSLEELVDEEVGAQEFIERVRREVLRTEELTWEQKKELESALAAEEERARAVEELAREMADAADKLEQGGLTSGDLLDKLDEIRELMAAVTTPELLEALQSLQQAIQQPNPEQLAEALRQFAEDQEAFHQRLDRTLELLRQVHAEQRLLAAVAQAEDLRDRQEQVDDALRRSESEARLRDQESSLARDADRLQEELGDLGDEMGELSQPTAAALQSQAAQMEEQNLSGRMREMTQELATRQTDAARRTGAALEEDLGRLAQRLSDLQTEFSGRQRQEMSRQLRAAMGGLVDLSQRQEALGGRTAGLRGRAVAGLAAEQHALTRGTELVVEQVAAVGSRSLAVDPGLPATLGHALRRMAHAGDRLGQLEANRAAGLQAEAVGYLNEAVLQLRRSVDNLSQARMPSGFGEAMDKMMGLSQQQAALNQATQQAMEQQGTQPGRSGRGGDPFADLPRLAAEQQRIYRALAELEKSLRGQRSLEERIGRIQEEMKSVLDRMQRRQADPRVTQGQQRVLQRMLDASRSIHARGFEKRRRAESGEQRAYVGPDWLPIDLGQRPDALREAMRRALAAGYPTEYLELIRGYYESVYRDLHDDDSREALP